MGKLPTVNQDGGVVIPVEENERLLAQNDEHGVAQLGHFRQHKHGRPKARHFVIFDVTVINEIIK
jgi:hypothetical protein